MQDDDLAADGIGADDDDNTDEEDDGRAPALMKSGAHRTELTYQVPL